MKDFSSLAFTQLLTYFSYGILYVLHILYLLL